MVDRRWTVGDEVALAFVRNGEQHQEVMLHYNQSRKVWLLRAPVEIVREYAHRGVIEAHFPRGGEPAAWEAPWYEVNLGRSVTAAVFAWQEFLVRYGDNARNAAEELRAQAS